MTVLPDPAPSERTAAGASPATAPFGEHAGRRATGRAGASASDPDGERADGVRALDNDSALLDRVRAGDRNAYGALWDRHHRAGLAAARAITSAFDAEDLVSEAFLRVMKAIERGNGPSVAFRPYLLTTVRSVAARWGSQPAELTPEELEIVDPESSEEALSSRFDESLTVTAFNSLPQRWQEVLWYTEAEQLPPREVAALIGIRPNAVSALAKRAREGLRHAWVQAHIATVPDDSECRWAIDRLAVAARKSLPTRERDRLDAHLDECDRCPLAAEEITAASRRLGPVLLAAAIGLAAASGYAAFLKPAAASAAAVGGGVGAAAAGKTTLVRNVSVSVGAAAAAAVVAAGIAYGTGALGGSGSPAGSAASQSSGSGAGSSGSSTDASTAPSSSPSASDPASTPSPDSSPGASPLLVSTVDTGQGRLFPIIRGTGTPGAKVTVRVSSASATGTAFRWDSGGEPVIAAVALRPAAERASSAGADWAAATTVVPAATTSQTATVRADGTFTLGPLDWLGVGTTKLVLSQSSDARSTVITVSFTAPVLALTAPTSSADSRLLVSGTPGAAVRVTFSPGGGAQSVTLDAQGHGRVPVPAGSTTAQVGYLDPSTGRAGPAQRVTLAQLPVTTDASSSPSPSQPTTPSTGSTPHSTPTPTPTPTHSSTPTPTPTPTPSSTPTQTPTPPVLAPLRVTISPSLTQLGALVVSISGDPRATKVELSVPGSASQTVSLSAGSATVLLGPLDWLAPVKARYLVDGGSPGPWVWARWTLPTS